MPRAQKDGYNKHQMDAARTRRPLLAGREVCRDVPLFGARSNRRSGGVRRLPPGWDVDLRTEARRKKNSMIYRRVVASLAASLFCGLGSVSYAATIDFESVPPGTAYGKPYGNAIGDLVLTQGGIDMYLELFKLDEFIGFNKAEIGGRYDDWFKTTPLELDNISTRFDFSRLGFNVTQVTLEFLEFGGSSLFSVNGFPALALPSGEDPLEIAPDVFATDEEGLLVLVGDIDYFYIGGQELSIDNVAALPEPTAAVLLGVGAAWLLQRRRLRKTFTV